MYKWLLVPVDCISTSSIISKAYIWNYIKNWRYIACEHRPDWNGLTWDALDSQNVLCHAHKQSAFLFEDLSLATVSTEFQ